MFSNSEKLNDKSIIRNKICNKQTAQDEEEDEKNTFIFECI